MKETIKEDNPATSKEMVDQMLQNLLKETKILNTSNRKEVAVDVSQVECKNLPQDIKLEPEDPQIDSDRGTLACLTDNILFEKTQITVKLEESKPVAKIEEITIPRFEDFKFKNENLIKKEVEQVKINNLLPEESAAMVKLEESIAEIEEVNVPQYDFKIEIEDIIRKAEEEKVTIVKIGTLADLPTFLSGTQSLNNMEERESNKQDKYTNGLAFIGQAAMEGENGKNKCTQGSIKTNKVFGNVQTIYKSEFKNLNLQSVNIRCQAKKKKKERMVKCDQCEYSTTRQVNLKIHRVKHDNTKEFGYFKCNQCNYNTNCKSYLSLHFRLYPHGNLDLHKTFKCNQCYFASNQKKMFDFHLLKHKDPEEVSRFKCDQCDYTTIQKYHYEFHLSRHKQCEEVKKCHENVGGISQQLKSEKKKPEEVKKYECDQCYYTTVDEHELKNHLSNHKKNGDVGEFKCNHCEYITVFKSNIKKHSSKHIHFLEEKIPKKLTRKVDGFKCTLCEYVTIYKREYNFHLLKHTNSEGKFKCDHCHYTTFLKGSLKTHLLRHKNPEEVRKFKCLQCEYRSFYKSTLKNHILTKHKKVVKFKCDECEFVAKQKCHLKNHMLKKHYSFYDDE